VNQKDATETCQQFTAKGGNASALPCDVTSQEEVTSRFDEFASSGPIHILVNNAGASHIGSLENTTEADFERIFQVSVKGFYNCMYASVARMRANGGGVILNMASIAGSSGLSDRFAYSMSKSAVIAMTYSVAKDYLCHNIRCNCISPARVHTPFVDDYLRNVYPGRERKCSRNCPKRKPSGEWLSRRKWPRSLSSCVRMKHPYITGADYPLDGGFLNLRGYPIDLHSLTSTRKKRGKTV